MKHNRCLSLVLLSLLLLLGNRGICQLSFQMAQGKDSCGQQQNQEKYAHYRFRLEGNGTKTYPGFIRKGIERGTNLPIDAFMPTTDCFSDFILNVRDCQTASEPGPVGNIRISDASTDLGWYIAVLATEYETLRLRGEDQSEVIRDLWQAIQAFDRLDRDAEVWYPGTSPALDGFFLRDDIPGDFPRDPLSGDLRYPHPDPDVPGYQCVSSAWSCGANTVDDGTFCSQDQMINVIMGMALVDRFVPETVNYNGDTLVTLARHAIHRMVKHLRDHDWTIRAPDGTSPPDHYGGSAITFSYKLAEIGDLYTQNRYFGPTYQNAFSEDQGAGFWGLAETFYSTQPMINQAMILPMSALTHNWEAEEMADKSVEADMEIYALLQAVIYEEETGEATLPNILQGYIDSAPYGGPCWRDYPGCKNIPGWQSSNRWVQPRGRNGDPNQAAASFNGLDFMLLFNLYEIYRSQQGIGLEPCPETPLPPPSAEIAVFPNPLMDTVHVDFYQANAGRVKIQLVNTLGKVILQESFGVADEEWIRINWATAGLAPGLYWVRVIRKGEVENFKLVKY